MAVDTAWHNASIFLKRPRSLDLKAGAAEVVLKPL